MKITIVGTGAIGGVTGAHLIPNLSFIEGPRRWGFPFRRGLFEIGAEDFGRIARAMNAVIEDR